MTSALRFQDMTPSMTPPSSDLGDCEDISMLGSEIYLPEVFYPSPAPSFSQRCPTFSPQSPDMGQSDTTYDAEEDIQQMFCLDSADTQMFSNTASLQNATIYSTAMSYQPSEASSWMTYGGYSNAVSMYPYSSEGSTSVYPACMSQVPSNIIPPTPQGVTSASFNFNDVISRPQDPSTFLRAYSNQGLRHSSTAPSTTCIDGTSSRSCSPGSSRQASSGPQGGRRTSLMPQRSSSSSLHAFGIAVRSPDSTEVQAWRCGFPSCTSRALFTRGCDLRKHYNRHSKHLFCRVGGCPQSEAACVASAQQQAIQAGAEPSDPSQLAITGGFSSKKDRARHEAKHNPGITCEWRGTNGEECGRMFSRMDNMKDHVRRIHNKGHPQSQQQHSPSKKKSMH